MTESVQASPVKKLTLRVEGNSLPQLFENVGRELLKTFINPEDVGEVLREKIIAEATDAPQLLKAWVEALINLAGRQHILFKAYRFQEFEVGKTGPGKLRSEITGELVDPLRHQFRKQPNQWRCAHVELINNAKIIEAQVILEFADNGQK